MIKVLGEVLQPLCLGNGRLSSDRFDPLKVYLFKVTGIFPTLRAGWMEVIRYSKWIQMVKQISKYGVTKGWRNSDSESGDVRIQDTYSHIDIIPFDSRSPGWWCFRHACFVLFRVLNDKVPQKDVFNLQISILGLNIIETETSRINSKINKHPWRSHFSS